MGFFARILGFNSETRQSPVLRSAEIVTPSRLPMVIPYRLITLLWYSQLTRRRY